MNIKNIYSIRQGYLVSDRDDDFAEKKLSSVTEEQSSTDIAQTGDECMNIKI